MIKHISSEGLIFSYFMLLIILLLTHKEKLKLEKDIIITFLKMSIQLFFAGFVLLYIFKLNSIVLTTLIMILMIFFATKIVIKRTKIKLKYIGFYLFISISIATVVILATMLVGIIQLNHFNSRYIIPLAGMVIGNSMNSIAINIERFFSKTKASQEIIEELLCMGANRYEALSLVRQEAFRASLIPTLSSASGMGIVFLPGMMTGQILSGINPIESVSYQIVIVISIATSVVIANYIALRFMEKTIFNNKEQIIVNNFNYH